MVLVVVNNRLFLEQKYLGLARYGADLQSRHDDLAESRPGMSLVAGVMVDDHLTVRAWWSRAASSIAGFDCGQAASVMR